ncbi:hypothetical protein PG993_006269 [Apiospora rasikravindrae]|uniref:Helicase ATP-binding domain-containing protein n=1 Tax=Apiospora rasikravindrae TaxID=990691 RepID=A0ABR1T583_9PEZI
MDSAWMGPPSGRQQAKRRRPDEPCPEQDTEVKRQRVDEPRRERITAQLQGSTFEAATHPYHTQLVLQNPMPLAPRTQQNALPFGERHQQNSNLAAFTGYHGPQRLSPTGVNTLDSRIFRANQTGSVMNPLVAQPLASYHPQRGLQLEIDSRTMRTTYFAEDALNHGYNTPNWTDTISESPVCQLPRLTEMVCYGMVAAISGTCEKRSARVIPPNFLVNMESSERFISVDDEQIQGRLHTDHGQMMQGLLDDETLKIFVTCTPSKADNNTRNVSRSSLVTPCTLDVVVYGPSSLYEEIGSWFEDYDIYLQDPQACHLDTKYFNPHRLSSTYADHCQMLSEVVSRASNLAQLSEISTRPDLLSTLVNNTDLEEAQQPTSILSDLKRHQKQALTFMLRRESGWGFHHVQQRPDIWEIVDSTQTRQYLNVISGAHQPDEPEEFAGGIVADPMGLGKTLTMISLIASDSGSDPVFQSYLNISMNENVQVSATLIIIPPPLLGTWEHELHTHVVQGAMRHGRHHGKARIGGLYDLEGIHVVLTTYHTVSAEWDADETKRDSVLFSVRWKRIILDEAHFIRNAKSRMARAVCALDAKARWAVTGTPIQNRLSDFAALLQFIRVIPYDDPRHFDVDIANLWKTGEEAEAVNRLKRLTAHLLLRRPKDTIDLPARRDLSCPIEFTRDERTCYEKMRMQTITKLDEALHDDSGSYKAGSYMNVLQQIESLRLFCNLGLQFRARHAQRETESPSEEITADNWFTRAQKAFQAQRDMQTMICLQCNSALEIVETLLDGEASPQMAFFSSCLSYACANCTSKLNRHNRPFQCEHQPSCPVALVSLSSASMDDSPSLDGFEIDDASQGLSSKVQTLISDLKSRPDDEKWQARTKRPLDSDVKLIENPTLEDQALARVHRLGQTKEVTTIRLYIRDSFEEVSPPETKCRIRASFAGIPGLITEQKVMELQESKRSLAGVLLSPHEGAQTDDGNHSELQVSYTLPPAFTPIDAKKI